MGGREVRRYAPGDGALDFPPRYRLSDDGALATDYELIPLPRTGTVYTETTVHMPVPGLRTPYSLVIVELDGVGVRALVKVTGAEPGTVDIGDRGRLALRRVAVRQEYRTTGTCSSPNGRPHERGIISTECGRSAARSAQ